VERVPISALAEIGSRDTHQLADRTAADGYRAE
jgi:hypothetical protein